mmetsp:Transcript_4845/g.12695  ORF Transcript_4845/g.12695 Transcript_4845/m.12695 type:complete len:221 (+) Transcript_4845:186-848(+)
MIAHPQIFIDHPVPIVILSCFAHSTGSGVVVVARPGTSCEVTEHRSAFKGLAGKIGASIIVCRLATHLGCFPQCIDVAFILQVTDVGVDLDIATSQWSGLLRVEPLHVERSLRLGVALADESDCTVSIHEIAQQRVLQCQVDSLASHASEDLEEPLDDRLCRPRQRDDDAEQVGDHQRIDLTESAAFRDHHHAILLATYSDVAHRNHATGRYERQFLLLG